MASAVGLGVALTLNAGAYVGAMAAGGQLARVVAPRRLIVAALVANAVMCPVLFTVASALALMLALTAMGLGTGLLDLTMNTEGAAVERDLGRKVLLGMHAAGSAGFALGALAGSLLASGAGPRWCAAVVPAVMLPTALLAHRLGPRPWGSASVAPSAALSAGTGGFGGVALLGIVLGVSIAAEVTAQMWSAKFLVQQAAELAAFACACGALFAGFQAVVRWFGDAIRRRQDDQRVITASLLVAAVGFATVATSHAFVVSLLGFALVGLGTACVVPCCFAMVAHQAPHRSAAALGMASLIAGAIRLPTPLYMGLMASRYSDAAAFAGVAAGLLTAALLAHFGIAARRERAA